MKLSLLFPPETLGLDIKENIKEANGKWKEMKWNALKTWDTFLEQLGAKVKEGSSSSEGQITSLHLLERLKMSS